MNIDSTDNNLTDEEFEKIIEEIDRKVAVGELSRVPNGGGLDDSEAGYDDAEDLDEESEDEQSLSSMYVVSKAKARSVVKGLVCSV